MKKLTEWFDGRINPVHIGVYERYQWDPLNRLYSYWDGHQWGSYSSSIAGALTFKDNISSYQCLPWRGLAYDPDSVV